MLTRRTVLLRHWDVFLGVGQKCINTPRDGLSRARSVRRLKVSTVGTYCSNRSETRREYYARVGAYIRSLDLKATSSTLGEAQAERPSPRPIIRAEYLLSTRLGYAARVSKDVRALSVTVTQARRHRATSSSHSLASRHIREKRPGPRY